MGEASAPDPQESSNHRALRINLLVGVIGAAAALVGSVIGGVTSLAIANSAYDSQKAQQAAQVRETALSESRAQRLTAYKSWLQNEEPVVATVGLSSNCLWENKGDREKCEDEIRNGLDTLRALGAAALDVEIFGSDKAVELARGYHTLARTYLNFEGTQTAITFQGSAAS